jgi:hypothetical protein
MRRAKAERKKGVTVFGTIKMGKKRKRKKERERSGEDEHK